MNEPVGHCESLTPDVVNHCMVRDGAGIGSRERPILEHVVACSISCTPGEARAKTSSYAIRPCLCSATK